MAFRGSIPRRWIWLSTLRSGGCPLATQDSLPAAGPARPDGIGYPQDSRRRVSRLRLCSFLELLGAMGGPWYVVSLREILLLTAPSGLLCGNWDFSSPFSRRCSHGYRIQVKSSSIAALSHHRQAFRIAPPAGSEGRPRALRYRGRGLCQGSFQVDARRFLRTHPHPTQRGRTQQTGL